MLVLDQAVSSRALTAIPRPCADCSLSGLRRRSVHCVHWNARPISRLIAIDGGRRKPSTSPPDSDRGRLIVPPSTGTQAACAKKLDPHRQGRMINAARHPRHLPWAGRGEVWGFHLLASPRADSERHPSAVVLRQRPAVRGELRPQHAPLRTPSAPPGEPLPAQSPAILCNDAALLAGIRRQRGYPERLSTPWTKVDIFNLMILPRETARFARPVRDVRSGARPAP